MEPENFIPCKANLDEIHEYINNFIFRIEKSQLEKFELGSQIILYKAFMDDFISLEIKPLSDKVLEIIERKNNQKINNLELYQTVFNDFQFLNMHIDFKKNVLKSDITSNEFLNGDPKKIKQFLAALINFHKFKRCFKEKTLSILNNFENSHSKSNQILYQVKTKKMHNFNSFEENKSKVFKKIRKKNKKINVLTYIDMQLDEQIQEKLKMIEELQRQIEKESNELVS